MRRLIAALSVAVALASPAAAHDHRLPGVSLHLGDKIQKGYLVESTWLKATRDDSGDCIADFTDGFGWPSPMGSREEPSMAVVRLRKSARPMEVVLLAGLDEDADGEPQTLVPWPFVLRPRPEIQPESWELVIPVPATEHAFFQLEASWRDEDGCTDITDLGAQYGIWRFHTDRTPTNVPDCTRQRVEALVREFVRAYNRGDSQNLERIWAQEPDFQWYFAQDEREGSDAENRSTLAIYFSERHVLGDRIRLRHVRVGPPNREGHFGIGFRLRRSSDQRGVRGMWHGKASATEVVSIPDVYDPTSIQRCALVLWSMGKE